MIVYVFYYYFVEALNLLLISDKSILNNFIKTLNESGVSVESKNNVIRIQSEINMLEQRKSRALDAMIEGTITKNEYNIKLTEMNDAIYNLNAELYEIEELLRKKNTIKEKIEEFLQMIEEGTKFTEFDNVFQAVIHNVTIGSNADSGQYNPYLVTYVFNLFGDKNPNSKIIYVGNFDCEYRFHTF